MQSIAKSSSHALRKCERFQTIPFAGIAAKTRVVDMHLTIFHLYLAIRFCPAAASGANRRETDAPLSSGSQRRQQEGD